MALSYTLHYWPSIPGRGEFVKLALEAAGQPYKENDKDVWTYTMTTAKTQTGPPSHFAVPILQVESDAAPTTFISQTSAILQYLAVKFHLDATDDISDKADSVLLRRAHVAQLTQTVLDLVNEAHDTHHPIATSAYYEEQKQEASRRAANFRAERMPKFLKHFNQTLESSSSGWLIGNSMSIADLALYQAIEGLTFAFPRRMAVLQKDKDAKNVFALRDKVASENRVAQYLQSDRRRPFNSSGIFRDYAELDSEE